MGINLEKLPREVKDAREEWMKQMELVRECAEEYYDEAVTLDEQLEFYAEALPKAQELKTKYFALCEKHGIEN